MARLMQIVELPQEEPVNLTETKIFLRQDIDEDDALITGLITTARMMAEEFTRRALITQEWELVLDKPPAIIELPRPPLKEILEITTTTKNGDINTVDPDRYYYDNTGIGRVILKQPEPILERGKITEFSMNWGEFRRVAGFKIKFKAGYGDNAEDVPQAIKEGILQIIGHLYENRESQEMPPEAKRILYPFKVVSI